MSNEIGAFLIPRMIAIANRLRGAAPAAKQGTHCNHEQYDMEAFRARGAFDTFDAAA